MKSVPISPSHPNWIPAPIPTPWDDLLENIAAPADWQRKRPQIKQRFLDLLRDDVRPPIPQSLDIQSHEKIDTEHFTIELISYNVEEDERAHAYLAVPKTPPPPAGHPAILTLHGTNDWGARQTLGLPPEPQSHHSDRPIGTNDFARTLANAGHVTLSPEHFCCAHRRPKEGPYDTAAFYRKHPNWSAIGKSTWENHIALNVLESLPFVDTQKLAVTGHSLGAQNSIFIAAYDDRIRCVLPNCAALTIAQNPEPLHWSRDHWYIYIPHIREQLLGGEKPPTDFHEILSLIAPRPLMEIFALNDTDPAAQSQRTLLHLKLAQLYRLLESPKNHAFLVHGDAHAYTPLTHSTLLAWFARHLK